MSPSRRSFLSASFAAAVTTPLWAEEKLAEKPAEKSPITSAIKGVVAPAALNPPLASDPAEKPSTLFLTWRRDPTTTMTVQWVAAKGKLADTAIYYQPAATLLLPTWSKQPSIARTYPMTDFQVHRAELTGLLPGTEYVFQLGKKSPVYRFRTMPSKQTDVFSFVSGGDVGVNSHAVANNQQAARQDPMFAIVGGDLGYDNGKSVDISLAFIRNYSQHMVDSKGRLIPLIAAIGNHEVDGGFNKPREKAPFFFSLFDGLYPEKSYATLDFGDYLSLVLLDSGHVSPIGGGQTAWLEKQLRDRVDHPNVFVVNHVPAYPSNRSMTGSDGKPGTGHEQRKYWTPLFDKHRVPVVLEHHDHTFKRTKPLLDGHVNENGVLYLGDGSWGKLRAPKKPEKMPILARTSEAYHLSLHRLEGEERFHVALDEKGKVMDVCRSGQRVSST